MRETGGRGAGRRVLASGPASPQADDDETAVPPPDPFFDPFRLPRSENVKAIIADVLRHLGHYEAHFKVRQRARRVADEEQYRRIVTGLVCDLIHRHLLGDEDALALSLSNDELGRSGRYASPLRGKQLRD